MRSRWRNRQAFLATLELTIFLELVRCYKIRLKTLCLWVSIGFDMTMSLSCDDIALSLGTVKVYADK